jgi:hypothetical protein
MPDIVIGLLIGIALGFGVGYGVRDYVSRQRRRRHRERNRGRRPSAPVGLARSLKCDLCVFFYLRVAWLVVTSALPQSLRG